MSAATRGCRQAQQLSIPTKVICNDHVTLSLDGINVDDVIKSLWDKKTKIKSVGIRCPATSSLTKDSITKLLEAIGSLPKLEKLQCCFLENLTVPFGLLAKVLELARRLRVLDLNCISLSMDSNTNSNNGDGEANMNRNAFVRFTKSLSTHSSLMEFKLSFALGGETMVDSIIYALGTVPMLEKVFIAFKPFRSLSVRSVPCGLTSRSIERICSGSSNNIKILKISGIELPHDQVGWMAQGLHANESIQHLALWSCDLDGRCAIQLAEMLRHNRSLEKLDISWNHIGVDGCVAIARALEKNSTLQGMYFHHQNNMVTNSRKTDGEQRCYIALEAMLQRNFTLKELWTPLENPEFKEKVQFYLQLNASGKRHILRNVGSTTGEWIDTLASQQKDVSGLFYFLSMTPHLFIQHAVQSHNFEV